MQLGLSSAAAPDADLAELLAACTRRGLGALELRAGDGHGVRADDPLTGVLAAEQAKAAGIVIAGYRTGLDDELRSARLAEALNAPLLLDGVEAATRRAGHARRLADAGAQVAVIVRGPDARVDAGIIAALGIAIAWDAAPAERPVGIDAEALLREQGARLSHITLHGGGPEAVMHEGRGVGELMGRLALAGYDGTLALAPGGRRYDVAWQTWLGRRGGWGCGSKAEDRTLVNLGGAAPTGGT